MMEFRIRDQGRELGSFTMEQIELMLDEHRIGMMAEMYDGGKWITIDELFDRIEHQKLLESKKAQRQRVELARREEQEQRKLQVELEHERERTRQMAIAQKNRIKNEKEAGKFTNMKMETRA